MGQVTHICGLAPRLTKQSQESLLGPSATLDFDGTRAIQERHGLARSMSSQTLRSSRHVFFFAEPLTAVSRAAQLSQNKMADSSCNSSDHTCRAVTSAYSSIKPIQGCGIKGFIPTSVIQGNLPLFYGVLVFGKPFLLYHRSITEVVISHNPEPIT